MDLEPDYQVPPPAYSEEQEFDQKVSIATERSVHEPFLDADGWEVYDSHAFEHPDGKESGWRCGSSDLSRIKKISQKMSTSDSNVTPLDYQGHLMNPLASSSQWHETNSLSGLTKPVCQKLDASASATLIHPYHLSHQHKDHYSPDGVCCTATHTDPVSGHVWQSERHQTSIQYSYDVQPSPPVHNNGMLYRASYQNMLNDTHPQHDGPSTKLRSLPPTPAPPRQLARQEGAIIVAHHSVQPPVIKFDASVAYSNIQTSTTSGHQRPASHISSFDGDAQYDTYSFYNAAVSAQLNPLKNVHHNTSTLSYGQQQVQTTRPSTALLNHSHQLQLNSGPDSTYNLPEISNNRNNRPSWH